MSDLHKLLMILLLALVSAFQGFGQAVDMKLDDPYLVPDPAEFPGSVTFNFSFSAILGAHEMSSDDTDSRFAAITVTLNKLDGRTVMPTGSGANLFTWTYNPDNLTYTGKSKDVIVEEDVQYVIVFANVPTVVPSSIADAGFNANLTPPGDLENSDPSNDRVRMFTPVLPVTLVDFNAKNEGSFVQLTWSTSEEVNSHYFEVQHSVDGKLWSNIGQVPSHGESQVLRSYSFTQMTPGKGGNLYRLKMVDLDGSYAYSRIRNLSFESGSFMAVNTFPNPASDALIVDHHDWASVATISLFDKAGHKVASQGQTTNVVNVKSFSPGTYVLHIAHKDGSVISKKVLIAH